MDRSWTFEQRQVIETRGRSLLVSAAAGSGKTAVLVQRVLDEVLDPISPVDLDRLLIVTFTNAAAAQLRERIRTAVTQRFEEEPSNPRLHHQMSLLYSDHIMTIDKFFLMVIRDHYREIDLDPSFRIGEEGELKLMRSDVCARVLEEAYEEGREDFLRFSDLYAPGKSDEGLEEMILDFWETSSSHAWPREFRHACLDRYRKDPDEWDFLKDLLGAAKADLEDISAAIGRAEEICLSRGGPTACLKAVRSDRDLVDRLLSVSSYDQMTEAMGDLSAAFVRISKKPGKGEDPYDPAKLDQVDRMRKKWKDRIWGLKTRYFSHCLAEEQDLMLRAGEDFAVLVDLADRFEEAFREEKQKKNILDFSDSAHLALQVLVEKKGDRILPTRAAREYQDFFEEIAIDEYQDSNEIQELLLSSVSRESRGTYNRFMVGDVKQSIYRFRMSDPGIFLEKYETYKKGEGGQKQMRIDLSRNFRSRPQVLDAVNLIFRQIMCREVGGIAYGPDESLYPGAAFLPYPDPWTGQDEEVCRPELILTEPADLEGRLGPDQGDGNSVQTEGQEGSEGAEGRPAASRLSQTGPAEDADRAPDPIHAEAEVTAARILQLVGHSPVWDKDLGAYRPAQFRDIVILMRTASEWANVYAQVLSKRGIPNRTGSRTGYFSAPEVQTILAYLDLLDNPRQDIPLAAVLRSEIGRLTDDQLATVKAGKKYVPLYDCMTEYLEGGEDEEIRRKLRDFWERTEHLRDRIIDTPIHRLLWAIYDETGFADLCLASPGGDQKKANLDMLVEKAMAYEKTSYKGLFPFVRYIEKMQKYDVDFGAALAENGQENLVRIMTIHASKGLEFPIVFVCGLGKQLNRQDARTAIVRDNQVGVGITYVDPKLRVKIPTLIRSAAAERTEREGIGEELRVLYVALTRAEEKLILTGSKRDLGKFLQTLLPCAGSRREKLPRSRVFGADSYLYWILASLVRLPACRAFFDAYLDLPEVDLPQTLADLPCRIRIRTGREILARGMQAEKEEKADLLGLLQVEKGAVYDPALAADLAARLTSRYPFPDLASVPAKVTVSELKKADYLAQMSQLDDLGQVREPEGTDLLALQESAGDGKEDALAAGTDRTAAADSLSDFERVTPAFLQEKEGTRQVSGATRGTLIHRFLADFDLAQEPSEGEVGRWLESMVRCDKITEGERDLIRQDQLTRFLRSDLGQAMRKASRAGRLHRENPFVFAVPAADLLPSVPPEAAEESVLVQGTIDAWYEDEDGSLVLVDYKTDRVAQGQVERLTERYRTQFRLYREALEKLTGQKVGKAYLYSLSLGQTLQVPIDR